MSASQQTLFRPQSLRARELAWLGRPSLSLGLPVTLSTIASVVAAVATAALVTFGEYTRRVDLHGIMLPSAGLITISATSGGRIDSLAVHEGDVVRENAPLYAIDVDTNTKEGGTQEAIIRALNDQRASVTAEIDRKQQMNAETEKDLRRKVEGFKVQIGQLTNQMAMQTGFVSRLSYEYTQSLKLLAQHTVTNNEMDLRQQNWMHAQSELEQLRGVRLRLEEQLNDAQYQLDTQSLRAGDEMDALRSKLWDIDQQLANSRSRRAIEIRAPGAGRVTSIIGHPGQMVSAGSPMLTIVPEGADMLAELLAPSRAVGFIRPGERVRLRYSAFPYQKFGQYWGTVVSVADAGLRPEELQLLPPGARPAEEGGPYYRVRVKPDRPTATVYGAEEPLKASMQVEAYVLLDRRPLYQWIMAPLYSVSRAVAPQ